MHAFLIIGSATKAINHEVEKLTKKLKVNIFPFNLRKIEEARELRSLAALSREKPFAILINSMDKLTQEAANAFLKNLEEPTENLYYILTAANLQAVLPTIVSRCQLIRVQGSKINSQDKEVKSFMGLPVGEKLAHIDKIRERKKAIDFVENLITHLHELLHKNQEYSRLANDIRAANSTLVALKANGNVTLQLTNLAVNMN